MSGKYSPDDLWVSLSESTRKTHPDIEIKLEAIWEAKKKRAEENGQVCYNGISYRLNSVQEKDGKVILDLGTFEYKVRDGLIAIPEYFELPEAYHRKGCFSTSSVKTSDGLYIMVELSGKSMNENIIELIGGIMETNIQMTSGRDVFQSFYDELEEEAGVKEKDINESYLKAIYLEARTNVGFYFEVLLNVSSKDLKERFKENQDVDIQALRLFTRTEYIDILKNHRSSNKHFIATILSI